MAWLFEGSFLVKISLFTLVFLGSMVVLIELGYRIGRRHRARGEHVEGLGALEGGVFGLMGLLLAFNFSGAATRFDDRRQVIVEEANDIGTAWLRLDLLPVESQGAVRDSFRSYVDARIATYRALPDVRAARAHAARADALQPVLWRMAVEGTRQVGWAPAGTLLLPALNAMFDITNTRKWATQTHPPSILYGLLGVLVLMGSLLAGYGMSANAHRRSTHTIAFAFMVSLTVWVILDLEFPRFGLIRVGNFDQAIVDVRNAMQ